jgi:hypothetical protein
MDLMRRKTTGKNQGRKLDPDDMFYRAGWFCHVVSSYQFLTPFSQQIKLIKSLNERLEIV